MAAVPEQLQDALPPGDFYYVTDRFGDIDEVYLIVEPEHIVTERGMQYACTEPHQRPAGSGWGDYPQNERSDHAYRTLTLLWVRPVLH